MPDDRYTHSDLIGGGSGGMYIDMALPYVDIKDPLAAVHIAAICSYVDDGSGGDIYYSTAGSYPEIPNGELLRKAYDDAQDIDAIEDARDAILQARSGIQDPMKPQVFTMAQQEEYLKSINFNFKFLRPSPTIADACK